ncbi:uncharacterized protein LOC143460374 [Clavelina lepadiformis]|uniref:uncharacterized protein LOC143460374 n=1 Tax=Clavelina lepadiformis TaxID=159417 RepID=UPI004041031E
MDGRYPQPISPAFNSSASCNHRSKEPRNDANNSTPNVQKSCASSSTNAVSNFFQWHTGRNVDQRLQNELSLMEEKFLANTRSSHLAQRAPGFEINQRRNREKNKRVACSAQIQSLPSHSVIIKST